LFGKSVFEKVKLSFLFFLIFQLIVDSASGLFRVDFVGRGELSERQVRMGDELFGY
jgi:hypothetical protein